MTTADSAPTKPTDERHLPADQHAQQQVAAELVGAERMDREQVDRRGDVLEVGILGPDTGNSSGPAKQASAISSRTIMLPNASLLRL